MLTQQYVTFFKELEKNNNKEWFNSNKKDYENHVKQPFINLVAELIQEIKAFDDTINTEPKKALFRINRDIRFAKDKTPYNTIMKANITSGEKRAVAPGYYLGISADKIHIGGGLLGLDATNLKKVRAAIADTPVEFNSIVNDKGFTKHFKALKGEQAKRLTPELMEAKEKAPDIINKQFYAMKELPVTEYINSPTLTNELMNYFKTIQPLVLFLRQALG